MRFLIKLWQKMTTGCLASFPRGSNGFCRRERLTPIIGDPIYISGFGEQLSYQAYLDKYGIDPEIAYRLMRGNSRARSLAKTIVIQSQVGAQAGSKLIEGVWYEENHLQELWSRKWGFRSSSGRRWRLVALHPSRGVRMDSAGGKDYTHHRRSDIHLRLWRATLLSGIFG